MTSGNEHTTYRPTPEFRDRLEEQVRRRYRRNARDTNRDAHDLTPRRARLAKAAAVVIISVSMGATAGFASAQIRQGGARDSLLAAARAEAMLAKTRFDIAQAEADELSKRVRAGAVEQQELAAAIAELRDMEARRNAAWLNIEEITASGQAPRDDLGAPLVGGRDYVKLRIALEATALQARLSAAEAVQANAERRARAGAEDENVLMSTRLKVLHERGYLSVLAAKLAARDDFLAHGTPATELLQRVNAAQLRADAAYANAELADAKARLARVEKMRSAGAAGDVDLLKAQLAVKELEVELQRLAARLRSPK